ncbi:MAG TPA: BsuPI-related putative proteinase inhibitor [Chthoniobacterales bacterium]|jgi:hypothetical protein
MQVPRFLRSTTPLLIGAALGFGLRPALAQSVVPVIPEEQSPFFIVPDDSNNSTGPGPRTNKSSTLTPANSFPLNKTSDKSSTKMLTSFFTDMFSSVQLVKKHSDSKLVIQPEKFSVDDRREITVTYSVINRTSKLLKLDFPTSQRIEILVRDGSGKVIEKWSDDRAFDDVSGVVMINPDERIQYEEKIATRDMQPGQTYTIEASLANNPEFTRTATVTPTGKARGQQPNPALEATPTPEPTPGA